MKDDATILRIRKARHQISERCSHDAKCLVEYYLKLQEQHSNRLLTREKSKHKKKAIG